MCEYVMHVADKGNGQSNTKWTLQELDRDVSPVSLVQQLCTMGIHMLRTDYCKQLHVFATLSICFCCCKSQSDPRGHLSLELELQMDSCKAWNLAPLSYTCKTEKNMEEVPQNRN